MKPRLQNMLAASAALAAVAFASAGVALADGMPAAAPPAYVPPYSWTGLYIGAQTGWMDSNIKGNFAPFNAPFRFEADPDTGIAGIHLGYQQQWGNIVLGIEGSWSDDFLNSENEGRELGGGRAGSCGFVANTETCNGRIYSIRDVGGKVGLAKDKWLVYAIGGYAQARINTWGELLNTPPTIPQRFSEGSNTHDGWFAGAGFDYALSANAIVGFQYKHYGFGDEAHLAVCQATNGCSPIGSAVPSDNRVVHADADAFMTTLSFKFGSQPTPAPLK
jgi:outer membrane immunogenic protein